MLTHSPVCLESPKSGERSWWVDGPHTSQVNAFVDMPPSNFESAPRQAQGLGKQGDKIRTELVARVRRELAQGTYLTEEKWELALQRLFEHMERE